MRFVAVLLVVLGGMISPAAGEDYYPLCVGSVWEYEGLKSGDDYTSECVGTETLWGIECAVFAHHSDMDEGLFNYWYKDEAGATRIRGAYRTIEEFGFLYDPGIQVISEAPFVGETWCDTIDIYELPDTTYSESLPVCFAVIDEGILDLPVGLLHAFGVGYVGPLGPRDGYDLLGRRCPGGGRDAPEWYSESVGVVQFRTNDTYRLASYSLPPSFTERTTWGRVKALYFANE